MADWMGPGPDECRPGILLVRERLETLLTIDLLLELFCLEGQSIDDASLCEAWVKFQLPYGAGVLVLDWARHPRLAPRLLARGPRDGAPGAGTRRGTALVALPVLAAYALRFASSWWLLGHGLGPRFDPLAFGTLGSAVLLSAAAPPLAGLLWWILQRCGAWHGLFAPASGPGWTLLSILLVLVIGAPTPNQVRAMLLLPAAESWQAMVSAACWFSTVALLRAISVTGPRRPAS